MTTEPAADACALDTFLAAQHVMSVATSGADGPACAAVFYAPDADGSLLFVSDPASRHGARLAVDPACAAEVHVDARDWRAIRGAQLRGNASPVGEAARAAARERYLDRFPELREQLADPAGAKMAERFAKASFYRFVPAWARLIDNARGFAARDEFVRDEGRWRRVSVAHAAPAAPAAPGGDAGGTSGEAA